MPERDMHILVENAIHLGCAVIPIRPDKRPAIPSWKEFQLFRPSEAQVRLWLQDRPSAMAIVTGTISRMVVLDFDGERGIATLRALGLAPHVQTGSGGFHVYFQHPGWHVPTVNSKSKRILGERYPGLDVRADAGYAIFAGRSTSGEYTWLREMVPDPLDLLQHDVREALGLLMPSPPTQGAFGDNGSGSSQARTVRAVKILELALHRVPDHGRNTAGFWLACQLRDNGYSLQEAEPILLEYVAKVPVTNTKGTAELYTTEEALNSARQAYNRPPRQPWNSDRRILSRRGRPIDLPLIEVSNRQLRDISTEGLAALQSQNEPPYLFVRSGQAVHIVADEAGRHGIKEISEAYLRGRLTRSADFRRVWVDRGGNRQQVATNPPLEIVRDILALPPNLWPFPPLESVTEAPIFRPDGTIIDTPGYDSSTRIVYSPPPGFRLPSIAESPTSEQIDAAVCLIEEMIAGFPFVDASSKANTFGVLLTPILRRAVEGCVPIALFDAPTQGTGKSLLAEVVSLIHTGNNAAMRPSPVRDEEEWRKSITSILASGHALTVFDNVTGRLDSPSLALAVTANVWSDRILGRSQVITLPQRTVFIVTGNNVGLAGDLPRRCYWIRLDAKVPNPWERGGFKIADLKGWVLERRSDLIAALLTIARSWYAAGRPSGDGPILGSFEAWCRTIGGILRHVSVLGFLENLHELYEQADPSEGQWQGFLDHIYQRYSGGDFGVVDLVRLLRVDPHYHSLLPDDLIDDGRDGNLFTRKVGNAFRQRVDRRYGPYGVHLVKAGLDRSTKTIRWRVEFQKEPPADYWPPAQPPVRVAPPPTGTPFSVTGL